MDRRGLQVLAVLVLILSIVAGFLLVRDPAQPFNGLVALAALIGAALLSAIVLAVPGRPATIVADFDAEGVIVSVPWQGRPVRVEKLDLESIDDIKRKRAPQRESKAQLAGKDHGEWGHRAVINFQIVDAGSGQPITEFNPPFRLQVGYLEEDVKRVDDPRKIELGFQLDNGELFVFSPGKHKYGVSPGTTRGKFLGLLEATVSRWGDPRVIVGP